jgi:hypothetical protein
VVEQPRARFGDEAYCPISGVVFTVKPWHRRRRHGDEVLYFCCDGCAKYYDEHRERVRKRRGLPP